MKFGYVSLAGRPNSGKSTLLNQLLGCKVSIVSDKPQTTRTRILGVKNLPDAQIVFVDTPGIHRPGYRLNERMMAEVLEALRDVDLLLHLIDVSEPLGKGEEYAQDLVRSAECRKFLLLNKVDKINKGKVLPLIEEFHAKGIYEEIFPISALTGENLDRLQERMVEVLPEGEPMFPRDFLTEKNERFLVAEIIREKVLLHTRQELPYATAVLVEEFDESRREEGFVHISASILVEKEGQKKIVIGRGGQMIKKIGTEARREIQELLGVPKVYLELYVRVEPSWRNRESLLDELGLGRR